VRAHHRELVVILAELHPGDVVGLGVGGHRAAEALPELVEQRRRRNRVAQVGRQERHDLRAGLQVGSVGVEVDAVQTLDIQRHVPIQDIVDRHHPPTHDASRSHQQEARSSASPQRKDQLNHPDGRSEAKPHWYSNRSS
jgi:hypothetical protein